MEINSYKNDRGYSASNYMNNKGINELFEAMMTALMIHKPDDHITFMQECLNKVENKSDYIRWDYFVKKSLPSLRIQHRSRSLPPVHFISSKTFIRPQIDITKPVILLLSSSGPTRLCSRLLERYRRIKYLLISDIADIDDDEFLDLEQHEHRYYCIRQAIEQWQSQVNAFLIVGELDEKNYLIQWQEKLGRIDLVFILSPNTNYTISNRNLHLIFINSTNDFEDILSYAIHSLDKLFPQDAFLSQRSQVMLSKPNYLNLRILFCIDNHDITINEDEFAIVDEEDNNNSFTYTLSQRLAEQFSFKHIHYEFPNFEQLKNEIIQSMNTSSGYIIDHFPNSFNDLQRFQSEIAPCSALIYIGDHETITKHNEINSIIEKFKQNNKAIYVNSHLEVDEIYEDLTNEILKHL